MVEINTLRGEQWTIQFNKNIFTVSGKIFPIEMEILWRGPIYLGVFYRS